MTDEEFYGKCAEILGTAYECRPHPYGYRSRWNNRQPGSGRFPDHGIIRLFGDHVQIALRAPVTISRNIEGREAAIAFLSETISQ